jgi:MFS transporter, SP family, general alpha glucoside:H+ symporter
MSLAMGICWLLTALITYLLPFFLNPLELNWSGKVGYVFGAGCFLTALYQYFWLPETFGFTLDRVSARKFRTYQLKGIENTSQVREKLHYDEKGIGGPAVEEVETNNPSKV